MDHAALVLFISKNSPPLRADHVGGVLLSSGCPLGMAKRPRHQLSALADRACAIGLVEVGREAERRCNRIDLLSWRYPRTLRDAIIADRLWRVLPQKRVDPFSVCGSAAAPGE
jgi:hypothetical protein